MALRTPRPAMCAVTGAPGAGKRTLVRGLTELLGAERVTALRLDDYAAPHAASVPDLAPDATHLALMAQHLRLLRQGETVFKPVRDERGAPTAPEFVRPREIVLAVGTHALAGPELRALWDVSLFIERDPSDADADVRQYVAPQRERADLVLALRPGKRARYDAVLHALHPVPLPALDALLHDPVAAAYLRAENAAAGADVIEIDGDVDDVSSASIEERLLAALPEAPTRKRRRLGALPDTAADSHRSNLLAVVQCLVAHYFAQRGVRIGSATPSTAMDAVARPARPVPGA